MSARYRDNDVVCVMWICVLVGTESYVCDQLPKLPEEPPPIGDCADDSSYYLTSETEADLNQGGVSLLQSKFPQRAVPEYLHKAVINFRCKQFLDVDQVQRQFQEQLDRLETAQEKHRRDPATEHQDLSWSGNLLCASIQRTFRATCSVTGRVHW